MVANADDPSIVWAARHAPHVIWVAAGQVWTADSAVCLDCGALLRRDGQSWGCPNCGFARPEPGGHSVVRDHGIVHGPEGQRHELHLQLPGRFNAANGALALVATAALGLDPAGVGPADGHCRVRVRSVRGHHCRGTDHPSTAGEEPCGLVRTRGRDAPAPTPVIVTINSNAADGRDPSWLWDVPFERLRGRTVVATGDRRRDLAVRLLHAGVDHVVIEDPYAPGAPCRRACEELDVVDCAATHGLPPPAHLRGTVMSISLVSIYPRSWVPTGTAAT